MNDRSNTPGQPAIDDACADAWLALALTEQTPADGHPGDDTLSAWHEHRLEGAAAQRVEAHVSHCEQCFATWSGLLALESVPAPAIARAGLTSRAADALRALFGARAGVRRLGALAAALFAAVALSVLVLDPGQPLPDYSISLEGNTKYFRNGADVRDTTVVFETGNQFRLILTPDAAYADNTEVALFVIGSDGAATALPVPAAEVAGNGALRIAGEVGGRVALPPGPAQLLVVVGQAGRLPDASDATDKIGAATTARTGGWQAWRIPIEVVTD